MLRLRKTDYFRDFVKISFRSDKKKIKIDEKLIQKETVRIKRKLQNIF